MLRKSVPVSPDAERAIAALRADIVWKDAAMDIAGVGLSQEPSEAEALAALVEVGRRVIAERIDAAEMAEGYRALRESMDDDDRAMEVALRRRAARLPD